MKLLLLLILLVTTTASSVELKRTSPDFESDLSNIVQMFKKDIFELSKCVTHCNEAKKILSDIESAIRFSSNTSPEEVNKLENLAKVTKAIVSYIEVVGGCQPGSIYLEDFLLANKIIDGKYYDIFTDKFCVNVFAVTFNGYIVYLLFNDSATKYIVSYKWNTVNSIPRGSGTINLFEHCIREIGINNRKFPISDLDPNISLNCEIWQLNK